MSFRRAIGSLSLLLAAGLVMIGLSQLDFKTWLPVDRTRTLGLVSGAFGVYCLAVSLVVIFWPREQPSRREDDIHSTRMLLGYLTRHSTSQHVPQGLGQAGIGVASGELRDKTLRGQAPGRVVSPE